MCIAVGVARHPREREATRSADEQLDALSGRADALLVDAAAEIGELLGETAPPPAVPLLPATPIGAPAAPPTPPLVATPPIDAAPAPPPIDTAPAPP